MLRFCFALVLAATATAASADLNGPLRVIDGDTVAIGQTNIRLHGIDAPENGQRCGGGGAPMWGCGSWVSGEVRARYEGRTASCVELDRDRYDRVVARCRVDGKDLGETLVESGLAFAYERYSEAYVPQERIAARRKAGLHATGVKSPSAFRSDTRRGHAAQRLASAPEGCRIKGNISTNSGARIYHVPGQAWYEATRISMDKGERWFCSEQEARAAGWRRALR
ncbi:Endonuclease YncB, thermonuclease family [Mameliella alba]|uniref:thermonuclease family protein n=1 Tax=Mameliella alba TaxID=561184 RepID=UPI00088753F3|nr:thermonuclease family protein [Mameliella alba]OWV42773.1 nuclease [Mameliella alba]PTR35856.1 endonuclease YncB(thermonuclease family) [Mameliella alba]GGF82232.1 succinoglycan biosynthesis protein [Mameliella alba]SDE08774.1 Endonuclease YncB, thermonuclease family [Mameliella alba]